MGKLEQRESFKCKESHWHRGAKTAVDISTGVAIYTAMILKVCGK